MMLLTLLIPSALAFSQREVKGVVVGAEDNEPLIGATVMPEGFPGMGTATDIDGAFTLSVPDKATKLHVSYVGYVSQTVDITPGVMYIALKSADTKLDEVMVVAYGTVKKSEYTGSAAVVGAAQLQTSLVSDATSALAGRVSGVQILSSDGAPGSAPMVRIRGVGSINGSASPLYVVDGVPFNGDVNQIPATDIESMTVLKDAASTALYGARGANGVILITTKSGSNDKVKINVDMRWGVNQRGVPDYDLVWDERNYAEMVYYALRNTQLYNGASAAGAHAIANAGLWNAIGYQTWTVAPGQSFVGTDGKFNPMATRGYIANGQYFQGDNWVKETFENKLRQEYNVSASGGTEKLTYYASLSYLGDQGIIKSSGFNRLNTSLNVDYQLKKWLKLGANMAYTYTNWNYPSEQTTDYGNSTSTVNAFALATTLGPMYPFYVRNADGSIAIDLATGKKVYSYGLNDGGFTRNTLSNSNPVGDLVYNYDKYISDVFRGKWFALINPLEGLDITGTIGYNVSNTQYQGYSNPWYGQTAEEGGSAEQTAQRYRTIDEQVIAQYSKTFNDLNDFSLMVGWEHDTYQSTYFYGYGYNIYTPGDFTLNNAMADTRMAGGYQYNLAHMAIFGRLNYNYNGKYYGMVSFRRDGSSRFAPGHRWGNFWSISAAWDMAKESWLQACEEVDLLKIKASFGQNGNDNLGLDDPYNYLPYQDFYTITGANGVWSDGTLAYKGNRDITWEKSNAFNVGVDYSFFQGKLSGSIEYFSRQTSDMLMMVPVAPSLGYSNIPMNVGSMRNSGLEVEINYNPIRNKNVDWNLNLNFTAPANKVLKLDPSLLNSDGVWRSGIRYFKEGESMYQLTLAKYAGVDPETGFEQFWAKDAETGEEYLTYVGSEAFNSNACPAGNMLPKLYGGFSTQLQFFGFDLNVSLSFQLGGKVFDQSYQQYMYVGDTRSIGQAFHKDMLKAWTPENPNSDIPMLISETPYSGNGNYYYSDRWLVSSNYLSLNNITFGYTLPKKVTAKIGLSDVRIYFAAENVALWSARKGMDPRQSYVYTNVGTYSPLRSLTGGLHLTF